MKKITLLFLSLLVLIFSCKKQAYYQIPLDANGNVYLTGVSSTTTSGISTLDDAFTVTATFATAKAGDVMDVELLQLQIPPSGSTSKQLLPLAGTQKQVTVGSDMKATVSYTRSEAKLNQATDYVTVVFNGATDYAKLRVDMVPAISVSVPTVSSKSVAVARTAETAYFNVHVDKMSSAFNGNLVVNRKNGVNDAWVTVPGSPFSGSQPFLVPISGTDFAPGKDTMYYSFSAASGTYTDSVFTTIVVIDPYFYLKKSADLILGGSSAGRNLLVNGAVAENSATAMVAVSGSLILQGGAAWLSAGHSIEFVPTTLAMYDANNSNSAIAAFNAGIPTTTADPIAAEGVYIFKVVNGPTPADVYYGMMKMTNVLPGVSVSFEYRIGNKYAHLLVIQ